MDNMVSNDRAEDAHESGMYLLNSTGKIKFENASGSYDAEIYEDSNNVLKFVQGSGGFSGLDMALATQITGSIASGTNRARFPSAHRAATMQEAFVKVASDGVNPAATQMIFDINKNGTSLWATTQANRLKLNAAASVGTQTSFDTTSVAKYDNFSVDVDQTDATAQNLIFVLIAR